MSEEINSLLELLDRIIERVREKAVDWWWLDQGNAPIIRIPIIESINGEEVRFIESPPISLLAALRKLRESIKKSAHLSTYVKLKALHYYFETLQRIYDVLARILEVEGILRNYEDLFEMLMRPNEHLVPYKEKLYNSLSNIRENINKSQKVWKETIESLRTELEKVRNEINIAVMKKSVEEKPKEVQIERLDEKELLVEG